jgi:hypothetical protein
MKDIHDFDAIVTASCSFEPIQGYYPGTGPDGSGDAQEPDGPCSMLSPMLYAIDHGELPDYVLEAVRAVVENGSADGLDEALIKELQSLGYSQSEIEGLNMQSDEATAEGPAADDKPQETKHENPPKAVTPPASQGPDR